MRIHLLFTVGEDIFGLGFDLDWTRPMAAFELQLGPFNFCVFGRSLWEVSLLGRPIYRRSN